MCTTGMWYLSTCPHSGHFSPHCHLSTRSVRWRWLVRSTLAAPMHLTSVDKVIEKLGGSLRVSRLIGVVKSAPANWVRRDKLFPAHTFITLQTEITKLGHTAPPTLWRMHRPPARRRANGKA